MAFTQSEVGSELLDVGPTVVVEFVGVLDIEVDVDGSSNDVVVTSSLEGGAWFDDTGVSVSNVTGVAEGSAPND